MRVNGFIIFFFFARKSARRATGRHALIALVLSLLFCENIRAAEPASEYQVKAALLLNFIQFVDWPPQAFPDDKAPIIVGHQIDATEIRIVKRVKRIMNRVIPFLDRRKRMLAADGSIQISRDHQHRVANRFSL